MTTWEKELIEIMDCLGETMADIEFNTLTNAEMTQEFDGGYGSAQGKPFTIWTARTVYFPLVYDGAESVGYVARNPDGKPTEHQPG